MGKSRTSPLKKKRSLLKITSNKNGGVTKDEMVDNLKYISFKDKNDDEIFEDLRKLGALNATIEKGYGVRTSITDGKIYNEKNRLLNSLIDRSKEIDLDVSIGKSDSNDVLYYRNKKTGIQLSFHGNGNLPYYLSDTDIFVPPKYSWENYGKLLKSSDKDYDFYKNLIKKDSKLWDGVNGAWQYKNKKSYLKVKK